jgi:hypothetical protein
MNNQLAERLLKLSKVDVKGMLALMYQQSKIRRPDPVTTHPSQSGETLPAARKPMAGG